MLIRRKKILVRISMLLAIAALSITATRAVIAAAHEPAVSAGQALQLLLDGNQRFVAGKLEHPNQTPARRAELGKGQHPFAAVLACSDSRTPPEIIFDRGLGDIFTVRVAGNVADQVVIESVGYSVKHLGARLVMVLGHRRCGAVTAAVEGDEKDKEEVRAIVKELEPAVRASRGHARRSGRKCGARECEAGGEKTCRFGAAVGDGQIGRAEDCRRRLRSRHGHDRDAQGLARAASRRGYCGGCVTTMPANDDAEWPSAVVAVTVTT